MRRGSTIIRNTRDMLPLERAAANQLATYFGLKPKKIEAVRVGKLNAVEVLLEILSHRQKAWKNCQTGSFRKTFFAFDQ